MKDWPDLPTTTDKYRAPPIYPVTEIVCGLILIIGLGFQVLCVLVVALYWAFMRWGDVLLMPSRTDWLSFVALVILLASLAGMLWLSRH